jgi:glycine betaine/proline transport system ATP-binding protein
MTPPPECLPAATAPEAALEQLEADDQDYAYLVDGDGRLSGLVTIGRLERALRTGAARPLDAAVREIPTVAEDQLLDACLDVTARCRWPVPVLDGAGRMRGVLSPRSMMRGLTAHGPE